MISKTEEGIRKASVVVMIIGAVCLLLGLYQIIAGKEVKDYVDLFFYGAILPFPAYLTFRQLSKKKNGK